MRLAFLVIALVTPVAAIAGDLSLSGTGRVRVEAISGQVRTGFNDSDQIVALRTTLLATYRDGPVTLAAELYDSRVYGNVVGSAVTNNDVDTFEPAQAFIEYDAGAVVGGGSSLKIKGGRMTLDVASRRLISNEDFRNTTSSFTGVRADWHSRSGTSVTALAVLPQLRLPDDARSIRDNAVALDREGFDAQLWAAVLTRPNLLGGVRAEFGYYGFAERDSGGRPTRDRHLHTVTARMIREPAPGKFDGEVETMLQFGSISTSLAPGAARVPVLAGFAHADIGYSFGGVWRPHLSLEFDHASGDDSARSYGRFDTLFGMRRADLGVSGLYNAIGRANLTAVGVKLETDPGRRVDLLLSARGLWLASSTDAFSTTGIRDPLGRSGTYAGVQFDNRLRWWLVPKRLRGEIDATLLARGRFLRDAPNATAGGDVLYIAVAMTTFF